MCHTRLILNLKISFFRENYAILFTRDIFFYKNKFEACLLNLKVRFIYFFQPTIVANHSRYQTSSSMHPESLEYLRFQRLVKAANERRRVPTPNPTQISALHQFYLAVRNFVSLILAIAKLLYKLCGDLLPKKIDTARNFVEENRSHVSLIKNFPERSFLRREVWRYRNLRMAADFILTVLECLATFACQILIRLICLLSECPCLAFWEFVYPEALLNSLRDQNIQQNFDRMADGTIIDLETIYRSIFLIYF